MEIGNLGTNLSSGLHRPSTHDWGWLRRQVEGPRAGQSIGLQLGELLYGVQLELQDLLTYRVKLAEALEVLDQLREPAAVEAVARPREQRIFSIGNIGWQPPAIQQGEPFSATPAQFFHSRKLLRYQTFIQQDEVALTHRVHIKLQSGLKTYNRGSDLITLSRQGMEAIQSGSDEPVRTLRLPPRFHRQVDFLKCAAGQ